MNIQQTIIDYVFHGGEFDFVRGLIAEHALYSGSDPASINREDFTGAAFWTENGNSYAVAYSNSVMVLNKNGKLYGVAPYDPAIVPLISEGQFSSTTGAMVLTDGML